MNFKCYIGRCSISRVRVFLGRVLIAYTGVYPLQVYWFIKLINGARKAFLSIGEHKEGDKESEQKKQKLT